MAVAPRYDRQSRIKNWNQDRVQSTEVYLIGSDRLSDFMLVDLLSMGFGRIFRIGSSNFIDFDKINPLVYLEQTGEKIATLQDARRIFYEANTKRAIVVECTNDPRSKYFSSVGAKEKNLNFFSGCSSETGFSLSPARTAEPLIEHHLRDFEKKQGTHNSMVCSAILSDEIRKMIMPLKEDIKLEDYRYEGIGEATSLDKKVLQVGAGAIGTFSALSLAMMNAKLMLIDFDTIEESNLNRQFLFYDSIGKKKAEVLAERVRRYSSDKKINWLEKKIASDFQPKNFDFVFSCVDNNEARYFMDASSRNHNIPLINAGSSESGCNAMAVYPGKTACLDCQMGYKLSEAVKPKTEEEIESTKRSPGECFHPSLIIPNQIAGALLVDSMLKSLSGDYQKLEYSSGFGIRSETVESSCYSRCKSKEKK